MTRARTLGIAAAVGLVALIAWAIIALPGRDAPATPDGARPGTPPAAAERKITATLFYISEDGLSLVGAKRDVPFGEPVAAQARHIVETQLGAAPAPLASAIPSGTTLRSLYVTERGDAFVDLSGTVRAAHTGGSLDELFTVYAVVNAVTVNLPAITRVQILIDGKEVDTLAGHVDLRHALQKNLHWTTP